MLRLFGALYLVICCSSEVMAQSFPRALVCSFSTVFISQFEGDWTTKSQQEKFDLTIAAIDVKNSTAQLLGSQGASDIAAFAGLDILNFLEITGVGNQTLTTVFLGKRRNDAHPAIHSRHMSILGTPVVSHFRGYCVPKS
jgi:hypothetical protein